MSRKRELDATIRSIISSGTDPDDTGRKLSELIDIRVDDFGEWFFVRKGAPIDRSRFSSQDRIDVKDLYDWKRPQKRARFLQLKGAHNYKGPRIIAEGDSWMEYPVNSDLIDWLGKDFAILSLARAGDTWPNIIDEDGEPPKHYSDGSLMGLLHTLRQPDPKPFQIVMLSVGGNDMIGEIVSCVHPYDPARPTDQYINHANFDLIMNEVIYYYTNAIKEILLLGKKIILHSYDYPNPAEEGQYIGHKLKHERNFPGVGLMREVVNQMIDAFYDRLAAMAAVSGGNVHLVNLRETIGTTDILNGPDPLMWADEMHGTRDGFRKLALKIEAKIREIS